MHRPFDCRGAEPARANRHMANLVFVEAAENGGAPRIAGAFETTDHLGRRIEAARFELERHHREARQKILWENPSRCYGMEVPKPATAGVAV